MECGVNVCLAPFHYLDQFGPVIYFLERKLLDGCACDDHAVEILITHLIESLIELEKVLSGSIFRLVCLCEQKLDIDLDRRIGKSP